MVRHDDKTLLNLRTKLPESFRIRKISFPNGFTPLYILAFVNVAELFFPSQGKGW